MSSLSDLLEGLLQPVLQLRDKKIRKLEERMTAFDDKLAELDQATTDVATELDSLKGQIAGVDSSLAAKLDGPIARLKAMATDPNNVDPNPAPSPDVPPATP